MNYLMVKYVFGISPKTFVSMERVPLTPFLGVQQKLYTPRYTSLNKETGLMPLTFLHSSKGLDKQGRAFEIIYSVY